MLQKNIDKDGYSWARLAFPKSPIKTDGSSLVACLIFPRRESRGAFPSGKVTRL